MIWNVNSDLIHAALLKLKVREVKIHFNRANSLERKFIAIQITAFLLYRGIYVYTFVYIYCGETKFLK